MMRGDLLQKVSTREALAILTDDSGNIVWETDKSPVAGMYHAYYEGGLSGTGNLVLYADQAGFNCRISIGFMLVSPRCLIFSCDMLLSYVPAHAPVL